MVHDAIIIGAGGAGCSAAIELKKGGYEPLVLSKSERVYSKTYNAQGGIQAAVGKDDNHQNHYNDTMKAGNYKSNPAVVKTLTENAVAIINWLESIGVEFDKINGSYQLSKAGGLSHPRVLSCKGSAGEGIAKPLWKYVDELGIMIKENLAVVDVEKKNNHFFLTVSEDNQTSVLKAKTVVLATGGVIPKEKKVGKTQHANDVPDGISLAKKINAKVFCPELMQFHPTGVIFPKQLRRLRLPETMRGAGAVLKNKNHQEFTNHLDTRAIVTEAIIEEIAKGNGIETKDGYFGVYMCTPMIDEKQGIGYTAKNYEKIYQNFLKEGIDLTTESVLVYPVVHYSLGGVEINEKAETNITGFFAAGETTWGVHGEDRLMGNSLLDIFVFGRIAGKSAIAYLNKMT